jgi:protein-S-isoprenylcysteine O-methyltransferase Ste14
LPLFLRALLAFLLLPGVVAYLVPLMLAPDRSRDGVWWWVGLGLVAAGSALLLWCVKEFYVAGRGTLAPWSPPRHLVSSGPYARSRNPMYVAVTTVLIGWAALFMSRTLLIYAIAIAVAFQMRVVLHEEPWLGRAHGEAWQRYRARVRRWV